MTDLRVVKDDELPEPEPVPNWAKEPEKVTIGPLAWLAIFVIGLIGGFAGIRVAMDVVCAIVLVAIVVGIIAGVKLVKS